MLLRILKFLLTMNKFMHHSLIVLAFCQKISIFSLNMGFQNHTEYGSLFSFVTIVFYLVPFYLFQEVYLLCYNESQGKK